MNLVVIKRKYSRIWNDKYLRWLSDSNGLIVLIQLLEAHNLLRLIHSLSGNRLSTWLKLILSSTKLRHWLTPYKLINLLCDNDRYSKLTNSYTFKSSVFSNTYNY